ncbi:synaptogyrin-4 isoform X3 [Papio anubis]|uniref:synaptogyrin-4 isoform X3 n=1 Tax=Papio anubis TaxID=9555 RepID=UPI0012AE701F|nr:synaptogyrin-4 isoform X3 [Papio anubis]
MHIPESLQDLASSEAVQLLRRPKTITRVFEGVFSLIIFSSLLTDGYQNKMESPQLHCILNSNNVACSFAVVASFLAFLSCLAFLVLDTQETHIADTRFKTAFQLLDLILAAPQGTAQLRVLGDPVSPLPAPPRPRRLQMVNKAKAEAERRAGARPHTRQRQSGKEQRKKGFIFFCLFQENKESTISSVQKHGVRAMGPSAQPPSCT